MSPARSANSTSTGSPRGRAQPRSTGGPCSPRTNAKVGVSNRSSQDAASPNAAARAPGRWRRAGGSAGSSGQVAPAGLVVGEPARGQRGRQHRPAVLEHPHRHHRGGAADLEHLGAQLDGAGVGSAQEVRGDRERVGRRSGGLGLEPGQPGLGQQHEQQAAVRLRADGPVAAQLGGVAPVAEGRRCRSRRGTAARQQDVRRGRHRRQPGPSRGRIGRSGIGNALLRSSRPRGRQSQACRCELRLPAGGQRRARRGLQVEPGEQQRLGQQRRALVAGAAAPGADLDDDRAAEPARE